jgi:hypothetical protein
MRTSLFAKGRNGSLRTGRAASATTPPLRFSTKPQSSDTTTIRPLRVGCPRDARFVGQDLEKGPTARLIGLRRLVPTTVRKSPQTQSTPTVDLGGSLVSSSLPSACRRNDPAVFVFVIPFGLRRVPIDELVTATGLSEHYCSLIRLGKRLPHARHWEELLKVSFPRLDTTDQQVRGSPRRSPTPPTVVSDCRRDRPPPGSTSHGSGSYAKAGGPTTVALPTEALAAQGKERNHLSTSRPKSRGTRSDPAV